MAAWCRLLLWCLAACAALAGASAAHAERRVAVVIGNSQYRHVSSLANPANDARLMAETLRALGFTLVGGGPQVDLDKPALDTIIRRFGMEVQGADVGLFFYAGHGVQVRGANYLVPIGANPIREADVDFEFSDLALVLRQMEAAGTKLNLVVLDACRNNPFGGRGLRDTGSGLAQMRAPEGTLISFATQPGNVSLDGKDGNSPYTKALAQAIRRPGMGIFDTINEVGLAVKRATGGTQQPWFSTSPIDGRFYFAGAPQVAAATPTPAVPAADPCSFAGDHWRSAESMKSRVAYEDHLARFPNCMFANLARARLQAMSSVPSAPPTPAAAPPSAPPQQIAALPPPANRAAPAQPEGADVVRAFYLALGDADGNKAASLIIPEKQGTGNYKPAEMTKFYGSLAERLRLIDVVDLGSNKYRATYAFKTTSGRVCDGNSIVTVVKRGAQSYIESTRALSGC